MARGRGSGKKSGSKPTSKARNHKQEVKQRYSKAREDAQLCGLIPTTPEGAVKPEQVSPGKQEDAPLPNLISQAIRCGWAVPEDRKPELVDELIKILDDPNMPAKVKVAAFNALRLADQQQYERDHPELAGKLKSGGLMGGPTTNTTTNTINVHGNVVQNNVHEAAALIRQMVMDGQLGVLEEAEVLDKPSTPGSG